MNHSIFRVTLVLCATWLLALPSAAEGESAASSDEAQADSVLFTRATNATAKGAFTEAISVFEELSDRGQTHPDTSFNRAIAYWQRAESAKKRPGDLGQAAAGFLEAAALRAEDADATAHLQSIYQEISRDRSRRGQDPVVVRPSIGRAVVGLLPESIWGGVSLLGALLLTVGLVLRKNSAAQLRLAGQINIYAGAILLVLFSSLTLAARHFRTTSGEAVVIVQEARLLSKDGKALKTKALDVETKAIPEGAALIVLGRRGRLVQILWGSIEAWVKSSDVRVIADDSQASARASS